MCTACPLSSCSGPMCMHTVCHHPSHSHLPNHPTIHMPVHPCAHLHPSDNTQAICQAAETGKNSWRIVGHEWHSVDVSHSISISMCTNSLANNMKYVAFLQFLSLCAKKDLGDDSLDEEDGGASEPPRKHLRMTAMTKTKLVKCHFDVAPSKMSADAPAS